MRTLPETTRLLLIRHGETAWNAEGRIQGQLDPPLSDRGKRQAALLAERLAREEIAAVYSSDLGRARATAEVMAAALRLPVELAPGLREAHFGQWQGLTGAEIRMEYPEEYRLWREDSLAHRPPCGERIEALQERSLAAADEILEAHVGQSVAVVAHGGPIRCLVCGLLELPLALYPRLRVDNGGITRIWVGERGPVLASFNDTCHLEGCG